MYLQTAMGQCAQMTGVAPGEVVPPAKVMSPRSGGTGIAKFAGAAPLATVQLATVQGAVSAKMVPPAKVLPLWRHHFTWCNPLARRFILLNKTSCEELGTHDM